jgi:hypothetical protein
MDAFANLSQGIRMTDAPVPPGRRQNSNLIEVQRLTEPNHADEVSERVLEFLRARGLPDPIPSLATQIVGELADNAVSHGRGPCGAFCTAQAYGDGHVELALVDLGVGVRRHLAQNPNLPRYGSDSVALRAAAEEGVSGVPVDVGGPRGYGIPYALKQIQETEEVDCLLIVRSGGGWFRVGPQPYRRVVAIDGRDEAPGTWIRLSLHG